MGPVFTTDDLAENSQLCWHREFMDESITEHHPGPGHIVHFSVDTGLPYQVAERQFRENFERLQQKKHRAFQIDDKRFAKWCDYGLLPYIDQRWYLRYLSTFQQLRMIVSHIAHKLRLSVLVIAIRHSRERLGRDGHGEVGTLKKTHLRCEPGLTARIVL
jgi:hypothetical protein